MKYQKQDQLEKRENMAYDELDQIPIRVPTEEH